MLDAAPSLRVVSQLAVGYDNIDVAAATRAACWSRNTPGVLTDATADLAFALMLAHARRLFAGRPSAAQQASGATGAPCSC